MGSNEAKGKVTQGVVKATRTVWGLVRAVLYYVLGTLALAIFAYVIFALVFSTDTERKLRRENRAYSQAFAELDGKEEQLKDVVAGLQYKDNEIYDVVFHANAPSVDPMAKLDVFYASDTIPSTSLASYTRDKADSLLKRTVAVDAAFGTILRTVGVEGYTLPPMEVPVKDLTYPQVGAGPGQKFNPFYKAYVFHGGLDLVLTRGTAVHATADGVVGEGTGYFKTLGNLVEIVHDGGYVTHYAHLDDVCVLRGQKVKRGQKIGTVGMTGKSYAPHLHYEVLKDGVRMDPVNYIFASVGPDEYANMLYMSVNTMQSMD